MLKIHFQNKGITINIPEGMSILEAAMQHQIPIYHTCGGNCSCSTCRVVVLKGAKNLSPIESSEAQVLDAFDLKPPCRLGCQAILLKGEVIVEIPQRSKAPRPNKTPPLPS
ncbi:MAG: hypothetical protein A3C47_05445 [Omnitrophica bacterium RIFCSPHIGHO2_02_FULL_51_18]|nr:MAG: hypothetical protein A3C47_05445 [Omnitrophica bacterium RIFCSPHIGHO2_02_FULL_51_18]